jgi:YfiR/HmsC-like
MRQETAASFARSRFAARARRVRLTRFLIAVVIALGVTRAARAEEQSTTEVEARFVLQLLRYVTWPESALPPESPLVVGVVGDDAFAATLRRLDAQRKAQDRAVEVRAVTDAASPGIHLLFVRGGDASALRELARILYSSPVLTVSDRFDFPKLGGDVGIERVGDRVSFSINRRKSLRGDLAISSKLLRLASEVK